MQALVLPFGLESFKAAVGQWPATQLPLYRELESLAESAVARFNACGSQLVLELPPEAQPAVAHLEAVQQRMLRSGDDTERTLALQFSFWV